MTKAAQIPVQQIKITGRLYLTWMRSTDEWQVSFKCPVIPGRRAATLIPVPYRQRSARHCKNRNGNAGIGRSPSPPWHRRSPSPGGPLPRRVAEATVPPALIANTGQRQRCGARPHLRTPSSGLAPHTPLLRVRAPTTASLFLPHDFWLQCQQVSASLGRLLPAARQTARGSSRRLPRGRYPGGGGWRRASG